MADEVSNKTIAVLVAVVLVISVVGTWTVLTQTQGPDLSWYNPNVNTAYGRVAFNVGHGAPTTSTSEGRVTLYKVQ